MNRGERTGEQQATDGFGRRRFLMGAAASAAAVTVGCGSDGEREAASPSTTRNPYGGDGDPFTLGVASGDPLADAVVIWTRLAPEPLAEDGLGGMAAEPVDVIWQVATDEAFSRIAQQGVATATAEHGHSVHVDVTGLAPATDHWYRFVVGDAISPVGRTRTLPEGSPERAGIAIVNCQMYENGAYAAYRHLLDEDIELVVHLGDYIYEFPGGTGEGRHSAPNRMLKDLVDFRLRYASYKLDEDLAAAHARFPWMLTWDDHEVANNYMGDTRPDGAAAEVVRAQKAAAYQAWWEHVPTRLDPPSGSDLAVYRDVDLGDLARLYLLDERQDAAEPPCRGETVGGLDYGDCDEVEATDRTRLGADQEAWLAGALQASTATWNLLGNPVVLAGVNGGTDTDAYYLDTWDGYPQARKRLIAQLAEVDNPVVLTGDYHAGMVLDVRATPFDQSSALVATEFMAPPISSPLFPDDVSTRTPQLRQQMNGHGYLTVEVTPKRLTATFRVLDDVKDPASAIATAATWTVAAGDPRATKA
jgi:alkaline phosphatase D